MAEELVQQILQAIQLGHQRKRDRADLQFKQDQAAREQDYKQQQIDLEHQKLDTESKHFDLTQKASKAIQDMNIALKKQQLEAGDPTSELAQNSRKAAIEQAEALQGPNSPAARTRDTAADKKALSDYQLHLMQKQEDADRAASNKEADDAREEKRLKVQREIAAANNATSLKVAGMREQGRHKEAQVMNDLIKTPYVQGGLSGDKTREDILKELPKPQAQEVMGEIAQRGGAVLTDIQRNALSNFRLINDALPKIDEYNQILQQHGVAARINPLSEPYKDLNRIGSELDQIMPNVGRLIEGAKGRMSNQQIQYAEKGFKPSKDLLGNDVNENMKKAQDFRNTVNTALDAQIENLPPAMREIVKQKYSGMKPQQQQQPMGQPGQQQQQPVQPGQGQQSFHYGRDPKTGKLVQLPGVQ